MRIRKRRRENSGPEIIKGKKILNKFEIKNRYYLLINE